MFVCFFDCTQGNNTKGQGDLKKRSTENESERKGIILAVLPWTYFVISMKQVTLMSFKWDTVVAENPVFTVS